MSGCSTSSIDVRIPEKIRSSFDPNKLRLLSKIITVTDIHFFGDRVMV